MKTASVRGTAGQVAGRDIVIHRPRSRPRRRRARPATPAGLALQLLRAGGLALGAALCALALTIGQASE